MGRSSLNLDNGEFIRLFESFRQSDWAITTILLVFVIGAFIGVPQWALIAGTVVAFGAYWGSLYAWSFTMISAAINFWLARWVGAERIQRYGGSFINKIADLVRRNGFLTSFVIRLVPTGPFVLVNMAAGVSKMKFSHFFAGTGLGIIPKILVVGLIALGFVSDEQSDLIRMGIIAIALILLLSLFFARKYLKQFVNASEGD